MATTKIDFSKFQFNDEMVRQFSELYMKKLVEIPQLNAFSTLITGIRNDTEIGLVAGSMGMIGKAAQGCGTRIPDNKTIATSVKKWELKRWEIFLQFCWTDLTANFGQFARKTGTDIDNLEGTDFLNFIETLLDVDILRMFFRFAWFNDTAAALYTDSPAGVYYTGVNVDYLNLFDGWFVQLSDIITADPTRKTDLSAYNGQATYALQDSTLTNQLAYEAILKVIDDAKPTLRSQPDAIVITTAKLGRKCMRHLQASSIVYTLENIINGLDILRFDGYEILMIEWLDDFIRENQKNGTKWNLPHRIVFTTKSNLLIGVEGNSMFDYMKIWHNEDTEYTNIKIKDAMDAKILDDELVQYGV